MPTALYRAEQVRELDRHLITEQGGDSYAVMQAAAQAAFLRLVALLGRENKLNKRILVVCGGGNNGGDGYVIARFALTAGYRVHLLSLVGQQKLQGDAKLAAHDWRQCAGRNVTLEEVQAVGFDEYDLIVDALLGTGLQREVGGDFYQLIEKINAAKGRVLAVDIPSGLSADTGQALGIAVQADVTVTFVGLKQGLFTAAAPNYCGEIYFDNLSASDDVFRQVKPAARLIDEQVIEQALVQRPRDAHKGSFGHVLVIGGAAGMAGAAQMAATAALRVGAGLVSIATAPEHAALLTIERPELMAHGVKTAKDLAPLLERVTVIAIGPGLGQSGWAKSLLQQALAAKLPTVIDADALNLLADSAADPRRLGAGCIITPHPGEAARLLGKSTEAVQADRFAALSELRKLYGAISILKGAGSLVATPDLPEIAVCNRGHPGMATGGMGDILSGIVAGLLAQQIDTFHAAQAGVYLHATAAERWAMTAGERGLCATDLLSELPELIA